MAGLIDDLLAAVGAAPALPGARCRHRHHLFDAAADREPVDVVEARHAQALGLCGQCPAATRCAEWFDSLPARRRPEGVVAGEIRLNRLHRREIRNNPREDTQPR